MVRFSGVDYAFAGLGDGRLYTFIIQDQSLKNRKRYTLGTRQIRLYPFVSDGKPVVFASSDRPTLFYSDHEKLRFANVNIQELLFVCSFNTDITPNALAMVTRNELKVGAIESTQRLHITTIPLGESPRRICHQESTHAYGLLCSKFSKKEVSSFKLLDDQTFAGILLHSHHFSLGFVCNG